MKAFVDTLWGYFVWLFLEMGGLFSFGKHDGHVESRKGRTKRVLMVSPFPPEIHGGIYRPFSFAKYAGDNQVQISVLTNARKSDALDAGTKLIS